LGERYVIWFIFILSILTASLLADWEKKYLHEQEATRPAVNLAMGMVFLLLPLALLPGAREEWWKQSPPETENTPVAATEWLAAHPGLPGPLFSEIGFSSYLEFALPERPTWIDTRFEVFPVEQWQNYEAISYARYDWESLLDATGANLLMVSRQNQNELVSALKSSSNWCELRRDPVAVIFQRAPCGGQ